MFTVKNLAGDLYTVYAVRKGDPEKNEDEAQFLIYDNRMGCWDWWAADYFTPSTVI